ncbi:unnamed protein product, partial [Protopolystoma xenopodis]
MLRLEDSGTPAFHVLCHYIHFPERIKPGQLSGTVPLPSSSPVNFTTSKTIKPEAKQEHDVSDRDKPLGGQVNWPAGDYMLPIGGRGGQGYSLFSESSPYLDQRGGLSATVAEALEELKDLKLLPRSQSRSSIGRVRKSYSNGRDDSLDLESSALLDSEPEEDFAHYRCPPGFDRVSLMFVKYPLLSKANSEGLWHNLFVEPSRRQFEHPKTQQFCWRSRLRLEDMRGYESNVTKAHVPSASAAAQSTSKFNDTFASTVATNITHKTVATSLPSSTVTGADSLTRGSTYLSKVDDMLRLLNLERFERK